MILTELDNAIIEIIETSKEFKIKDVGKVEMEYIHGLGIHLLHIGIPIFYDKGALVHFLETQDDSSKTKRLTPSQTIHIIREPEIILPNFSRGRDNSYVYVGKIETTAISIVEVLLGQNKIRITHGGFQITDPSYLKKAKELRNTILEGRHSLMSQLERKSND